MINQPEERPLSIGSAVQFTHKGKTIHGHLLQRQGRRRFAKIVDTEERTWKVPESALKHSGGARRVTIITRHDKARLPRGGRGDVHKSRRTKTWFDREAQPEERTGTLRKDMLERLLWFTPQGGKGKREERCGETERRRGNGEAVDGRAWAHGLDSRVRRGQKRLGDCHFRYHVIRISRTHALEGSEEQIRDTVLHEIAHAIAGHGAGHGPLWKATARRIGATPRAKTYESQTS